jgi:Family of unknown function (DUF5723)
MTGYFSSPNHSLFHMKAIRCLLWAAVIAGPSGVIAQTEYAAFLHSGKAVATTFATDYQCIGINPANLGWSGKYEKKKFTFGLGEVTSSFYSDALSKDEMTEHFLKDSDIKFSYAEKAVAADAFSGTDFTVNIDVRSVGFAMTTAKAGGFAFHRADRVQWWSNFTSEASDILFMGRNAGYFDLLRLSTGDTVSNDVNLTEAQRAQGVEGISSNPQLTSAIMGNSAITHQWTREYALAWGYLMGTSGAWNFYGGATARYLQGVGMVEIRSEGGKLTAFTALSPGYEIDYGTAAALNPSTVTGDGFKSVGSGFAADAGFSAEILGKAKIGISYTNIGSITWDGNVYEAKDGYLTDMTNDGFDSYNIFDEAELITAEGGLFEWAGLKEKKVQMPSQLRTGASIKIKTKTELGVDVVIPTNDAPGNYEELMYAVGGEVAPMPWFSVNTGVSIGGMYKTMVPFGLNFRAPTGSWEGGVATRDITGLLSQEPGFISYCFGFLRFRM